MNTRFLPLRSIKTRVTLTTLTIFLLSTWVLTFSAIRLLQADMERLLGEQQYSTVSVAASAINDDFSDRLRALEMWFFIDSTVNFHSL